MDISIPIFIILIVIGLIAIGIGFKIKGKEKVFGRQLDTSKQTWARFWLTCGWVILALSILYLVFGIILHLYLKLY
ncbi:hypothetical protein [Lactobacillus sp.]|uniref:hypothetical protein n=1 Tax=Lactobacillus sp. TaxID=1591 RepID=UPI0019C5A291|nr:hypothetical protein [Lactobacillus sp.]MBD5429752.1 hypothetical protein [Lactobacillus sp.]